MGFIWCIRRGKTRITVPLWHSRTALLRIRSIVQVQFIPKGTNNKMFSRYKRSTLDSSTPMTSIFTLKGTLYPPFFSWKYQFDITIPNSHPVNGYITDCSQAKTLDLVNF